MENKNQRSGSILIFSILFLLAACSKENAKEKSEVSSLFKTYAHDGLTLRYPDYWTFSYDDSPSLYADRGVSFNVSEISGVSIFIYKDDAMNLAKVADYYERTLNLKSDEYTKSYQRQLVEVNGSKGEKLLWSDTMFDTTKFEVTIFPVAGAPTPTFAVFHLLDEDIGKESSNIIHFMNSILFQREESLADLKDFVSYTKEGLSVLHPSHWILAHDGYLTPTSGRGVAFDTSKHSRVMVLIYDAQPAVIKDLVDQYIRELKLESESIENYRKKSVELGSFQGVQLSWWDGPVTAEITIVEISNEKVPIFAVFQLMNNDIINESQNLIPFLKNIRVGSSQKNSIERNVRSQTQSYKKYNHDGLSLQYPSRWELAYDETPSIYADRTVAFDTSESSRVSVLVYKDRVMTLAKIADQFVRQFRLDSNEYVKDYQQKPIKIEGFSGIKISWQDVMIGSFPVEVTILDLATSPDAAFVVSQLHDEDIPEELAEVTDFAMSVILE